MISELICVSAQKVHQLSGVRDPFDLADDGLRVQHIALQVHTGALHIRQRADHLLGLRIAQRMTQRKITNGFFHVVAVQRALQADPAEKVLAFRQAEMKGKAELHRMRTADRMMPIGKPLFDAAGHRDLRLFKPCADKSALFSRILLPFIAMRADEAAQRFIQAAPG